MTARKDPTAPGDALDDAVRGATTPATDATETASKTAGESAGESALPQPAVDYAALVRFEVRAPRARGRKEDQIRHTFGLSMPQYYYHLRKALDAPEIAAALPREVTMLRARRATHR